MKKYVLIAVFSLIGGMAGSVLFQVSIAYAEARNVKFGQVQSYNKANNRVGFYGVGREGQGKFFLFDENGDLRVQAGSYGVGSEKGQSLFGLHDRNANLRLLFRMHGQTDAPTLIMKDNAGSDKIVMGLDPNTQVPYLNFTDSLNQQRNLFAQ